MSVPQRNGVHPFDDALAQEWLLSWIVPSLQVLKRNALVILPVALGYGVFVLVLPYVQLSGFGQGGSWRALVDGVVGAMLTTAICGLGYARLARAEGGPHGLGYLAPTPGIAQRLALVTGFWLLFGLLLVWILRGLLYALAKSSGFIELSMWTFGKLGWWSIPFVLWLFSPIGFWLATLSALTQIRAIRGEESVDRIILDSFARVQQNLLRIVVPAYLLTAALILVTWIGAELIADGLVSLIMHTGRGFVFAAVALAFALMLPFWFVIERVYAPELGLEDDVEIGLEDAGEDLSALVAELSLADQLTHVQAEQGPEVAARQVANWVRARQAQPAELLALFRQCAQPDVLARELSAVAIEWTGASKAGDLGWLVDQGLTLAPAFMMDAPGQVLALARGLTAANRSDLATRLLLNMLKQHRTHPDHLAAGLQLARVLATHSNNVDGARKLLGQLSKLYPDEAQISQLSKQLG